MALQRVAAFQSKILLVAFELQPGRAQIQGRESQRKRLQDESIPHRRQKWKERYSQGDQRHRREWTNPCDHWLVRSWEDFTARHPGWQGAAQNLKEKSPAAYS